MRIKYSVLATLSGLSLAVIAAPAMANGCGLGSPANCGVGVHVIPSEAPSFGPMTIQNSNPMGHLRSIDFQRSPHVSITRIHGMAPTASLRDAPSGFTQGCHPSSTHYCRANAGEAVNVQLAAPVVSAPVVSAPVYTAPAPTLRSWTGQGFNPANFQSRQYGDSTFTPGIAHIPTSIVDRSPVNAQTVLNSGRTIPQPVVSPSRYSSASLARVNNFAAGSIAAQPSTPLAVGNGTFASNVAPDGTYWEKTSGLTTFGDTVATQVICKRQLPRQVVNPVVQIPVAVPTRVVNPVVPVPVAVPTPVPVATPVCRPAQHIPHAGPHNFQAFNGAQASFGTPQGSRWVY